MGYYLEESKIDLHALKKRISETDLVPSRSVIMENIGEKFKALKECGIDTLKDLRRELKKTGNIPSMSDKTGISAEYLTLLRREIESFFPKTFPVKAFDWLPGETIARLEEKGYGNTEKLYDALCENNQADSLAKELAVEREVLDELACLSDLVRIQWTSPLAAKMMYSAGCRSARDVARADADILCGELDRINKENNFFKGKIGLRDVKRLIKSASYLT